MVHGAGAQQLFLVVSGLAVVFSPFIVALLNRRARDIPPGTSVRLSHWLIWPMVTCAVAGSVLQLLVLEDVAGSRLAYSVGTGTAALVLIAWAVIAGRSARRPNGLGRRSALFGLMASATLLGLALGLAINLPSPVAEIGVAFFAGVATVLLVAWLSPLGRRLERRRLGFGDAQLGVTLAVLAAVLLVSYLLAALGDPAIPAAATGRSRWDSSAAASVTGWRQANERQT